MNREYFKHDKHEFYPVKTNSETKTFALKCNVILLLSYVIIDKQWRKQIVIN